MAMRVQGPNGAIVEFPDGTDEATIGRAMMQLGGAQPQPQPQQAQAPAPQQPELSDLEKRMDARVAEEGDIDYATRLFNKGLPFGSWIDEGISLGKSVLPEALGGMSYDDSMALEAARDRAARKKYRDKAFSLPVIGDVSKGGLLSAGGTVASLPIAPALNIAKGAGLGARTANAAATGAAYGGAYGLGEGEGTDRLGNAGVGLALGGGLGAGLTTGMAAARGVKDLVRNPMQAVVAPKRRAAEKLAEAFRRDAGNTPIAAPEDLGNMFGTPISANARAARFDPDSMVADLGGKNVQSKMRSALNTPNAGRDSFNAKLDTRQANQWKRIEDQIAQTFGDQDQYFNVIDTLQKSRKERAGPAFQDAFDTPLDNPEGVLAVLQRPAYADIAKRVFKDTMDLGKDPNAMRAVELVHRIKVKLDREIATAKKRGTDSQGKYDLAHLVNLKHNMMNALDGPEVAALRKKYGDRWIDRATADESRVAQEKASYKYKLALRDFGDSASIENALEAGYDDFLKSTPEAITRTLKGLNDFEKRMYKLGAGRALAEKNRAGSRMHDRTKRDYDSPAMEMQLKALLGDLGHGEFDHTIKALGAQAQTRRVAQGNSTTAAQLKEMADDATAADLISTGKSVATGNLAGLLAKGGQIVDRLGGMTPRVAEETLRLLEGKPSALRGRTDLVKGPVEKAIKRQNAADQYRDMLIRLLTQAGAIQGASQ